MAASRGSPRRRVPVREFLTRREWDVRVAWPLRSPLISTFTLVGALAPLFDTTIVNVAVDTLGRDLHTSVTAIQWVVTGYLLALGMVIPLSGWSVARFGGKRMWMLGVALFLVGSVLSGAAWNISSLIAFRVLQGIGGGLMMPIVQTLIVQAAGGRRLGRLMAVVTTPALVGPILGPVLGGMIVGNLSWRWIFYFNVPICVAAPVLAWRGLPTVPPHGKQRLDVLGLILLPPALASERSTSQSSPLPTRGYEGSRYPTPAV